MMVHLEVVHHLVVVENLFLPLDLLDRTLDRFQNQNLHLQKQQSYLQVLEQPLPTRVQFPSSSSSPPYMSVRSDIGLFLQTLARSFRHWAFSSSLKLYGFIIYKVIESKAEIS